MDQVPDIGREEKIKKIVEGYDLDLKDTFGEYKIIDVYTLDIYGKNVDVVYLCSTKRAYKDPKTGTVSYGYNLDDKVFINLAKNGHWQKNELTSFYLPTELGLTFLHEVLHFVIEDIDFTIKTKNIEGVESTKMMTDDERENPLKNLEMNLRRLFDYSTTVMI